MSEHASFDVEHEQPSSLRLAGWGIAMVVVLAVVIQVLTSFFDITTAARVHEVVLGPVAPALIELRQREEKQLGSYGWQDKEKQVVRIPIERAMEKLVEERR